MKSLVGSSKALCFALSSAVSSDGFKTANPSSVVSCKLWGHGKLDSTAALVFSKSRTAAVGEFSDQSHLQFYAKIVCEKKTKNLKNKNISLNASVTEVLQICDDGLEAEVADGSNVCCGKDAFEAAVKQLKALEDELKANKEKLKAKKKEMKAVMKAKKESRHVSSSSSSESSDDEEEMCKDKMRMQSEQSEEMKAETKAKKNSKCDSSSSSSESSDCENEVCMDKMRMQSEQSEEMKAETKAKKKSKCDSSSSSSESSDCENEVCLDKMRMQSQVSVVLEPSFTSTIELFSETEQPPAQSVDSLPSTIPMKENLFSQGLYTSGSFLLGAESYISPARTESGRVEVCTGGKCQKNGSQQVLSAFQECIPATSSVAVSACKCMGKCGKGPNVRVHSGNDKSVPQVYTAVSEEDAKFLAHYHFGVTSEQGIPVMSVHEANSIITDSSMCVA